MKKLTFALLMTPIMMIASISFAANEVPHTLNFQSILRDDGGNLIPDGPMTLNFKILDVDGTQLYQETQNADVVRGAVNVMIGEGDIPGFDTATGGIPLNALDPTHGEKFVQYQIGTNQPIDPISIGSIPYAMWAEKSFGVVNEGVTTESIRNGTIKAEDLEPGSVQFSDIGGLIGPRQLPADVVRLSELTAHKNESNAHMASKIGFNPGTSGLFSGAPATTVQEAIERVDGKLNLEHATFASHIAQTIDMAHSGNLPANRISGQINGSQIDFSGGTSSLDSRYLNSSGDETFNGNLTVTGNIIMSPSRTVDGVDLSSLNTEVLEARGGHSSLNERFTSIEGATITESEIPADIARDTEVPSLAVFASASFVGLNESLVILPPVAEQNVLSLSDMGPCSMSINVYSTPYSVSGRRYRVVFRHAASSGNYVVMLTGHDGSAYSPVVMEKTGAYFDVCELVHGLDMVSSYAKFDILVFKP